MTLNPKLNFDTPNDDDCEALSALVFESKASHGYTPEFMEMCREEILVTPQSLQNGPAQMVWLEGRDAPLGFTQIVGQNPQSCELQALFIATHMQGYGIGRKLFDWATTQAKVEGYAEMIINSDPGAEAFYLANSAARIGNIPSGSIPGRKLPRLKYDLTI